MSLFTSSAVRELESAMTAIITNDYAALSQDTWWSLVTKVRETKTKKELLTWLISMAYIAEIGQGGNLPYNDGAAMMTELETKHSGSGLKITRAQLEDIVNGEPGGEGVDQAGQWARDIAQYMAYWPQKKTAQFLRTAHLLEGAGGFTAYDNLAFFSAAHPVNPRAPELGTFSNLFTGADAAPIDVGVSMEVASNNLSKVWASIKSIKMPNGQDDFRKLKPKALIVPPRMFPRAKQLTSADFIAQSAAGGGGGSADFRAFLSALGFAQPVCADELSGFESETSYFVVAEQAANDQMGGVIYLEREKFRMTTYDEITDAELGRKQELEWQLHGRNAIAPGHPFLLFKVKAS